MPAADDILNQLTTITNQWTTLSTAWHALFGILLLGLWRKRRPSARCMGAIVALPLISVSALAWASGNPFNGTVFALLSVTLIALAFRLSPDPVVIGSRRLVVPGAALVVFGWIYPHFLQTSSWTEYLYAAPLGLIPCPTLSAVVGIALLTGMAGSRPWSATLAAAGVLYGTVGAFRLGVWVDLVLLAGAVMLAALVAFESRPRRVASARDRTTTCSTRPTPRTTG